MKRVKHPNYIRIILCRSANNQSYYLVIVTDFINGIHNLLTFDGILSLTVLPPQRKTRPRMISKLPGCPKLFMAGKSNSVALTNRSLYVHVLQKH